MRDSTRRIIDHPMFHWAQILATASAAGWAISESIASSIANATGLAAVAALGIVLLVTPNRLAPLFRLILLAAAYINAAAYVLNLWIEKTVFDEGVHALTSFAGTAAVAWLLLARTSLLKSGEWMKVVAAALAIGAVFGIAWEGFEWLIGIIGDRRDTIVDLVMDLVGAVAAGLFCAWAAELRRESRG